MKLSMARSCKMLGFLLFSAFAVANEKVQILIPADLSTGDSLRVFQLATDAIHSEFEHLDVEALQVSAIASTSTPLQDQASRDSKAVQPLWELLESPEQKRILKGKIYEMAVKDQIRLRQTIFQYTDAASARDFLAVVADQLASMHCLTPLDALAFQRAQIVDANTMGIVASDFFVLLTKKSTSVEALLKAVAEANPSAARRMGAVIAELANNQRPGNSRIK